MEFEDLQKIWSSQNNKPFYVINEEALHRRIVAKKKKAGQITNVSELLLIAVNVGTGLLILGMNLSSKIETVSLYVMALWMFATALYVISKRIQRLKESVRFDRSMLGDLTHAIATATYQVRLSFLMRWNIVPTGILVLLGLWEGGKSMWIALGTLAFLALTYYASGWEHSIYQSRRHELEILQNKLRETEHA